MEFKINQQHFKIIRRESFLATLFVTLILFIGAAGIIGPDPGISRFITAGGYIIFFGLILKYIRSDLKKTELEMQAHRLVIENNRLIIKQDDLRKEIDLHDIHSIRFKYKKKNIHSVTINIRKNNGFKIEGYEGMDAITRLLKESVRSSKIGSFKK